MAPRDSNVVIGPRREKMGDKTLRIIGFFLKLIGVVAFSVILSLSK
jgi:hypothetical protein